MAAHSSIEWTDASWSPIRARNLKTGKIGWHCEHATTGCEFCYAEGINKRLGSGLPFKPGHRKDIEIFLDDKMLHAPLHWKKPRLIFVCSMTDLFADFVEDRWIDRMFSVMGACEEKGLGHIFQILTKRSDRMLRWMEEHGYKAWNSCRLSPEAWPARNVWLGISAERQQEADERIPLLLQTPAAVRFVSAEPLLGPINLTELYPDRSSENAVHALAGIRANPDGTASFGPCLDWVIVGGESGPHARPMHPDWARSLRDQCAAAGVAFFLKQHGEFREYDTGSPEPIAIDADGSEATGACGDAIKPSWITIDGRHILRREHIPDDGTPCRLIERVGKKAAGRLLDGVEHSAFPSLSSV